MGLRRVSVLVWAILIAGVGCSSKGADGGLAAASTADAGGPVTPPLDGGDGGAGDGAEGGTGGKITLPPSGKVSWDWQIGAGSDANVGLPAGVRLLDVDGFDVSAATVASFKNSGVYTVCYINAGSYEPARPDSAAYTEALKLRLFVESRAVRFQ